MQHELLAYSHIMQRNLVTESEMRGPAFQVRCNDMDIIAINIGKIVSLYAQYPFDSAEKMK